MCSNTDGQKVEDCYTDPDFLSIFVNEVYANISRMSARSCELLGTMDGVPDEVIQADNYLWPVSKKCFSQSGDTLVYSSDIPMTTPVSLITPKTALSSRSSDDNTLFYNYPLELCPRLPRVPSSVFFEKCGYPDVTTLNELMAKKMSIIDVMLDKENAFSKKFLRIKDSVFFCWGTKTIFKTLHVAFGEDVKNFTFEAFICSCLHDYIGTKKCIAVYSELWLVEYEYVGPNIDTLLGRKSSVLDKHFGQTNTPTKNLLLVAHQLCGIMMRFGELGLAFFDAKPDNFCVDPSTQQLKCIDAEHVIPFSFGSPEYECRCEDYKQLAPEMTLQYSGETGVFTNTWGVAYCLKDIGRALKKSSSEREREFLSRFQTIITNIIEDPSVRRATRLKDIAHTILCYHSETEC